MKRISLFATVFCIAFFSKKAFAQAPIPKGKLINVTKVRSESVMSNKMEFGFIEKDADLFRTYRSIPLDSNLKPVQITPNKIDKNLLAHFTIFNPSNELITVAFYPGSYFTEIQLYRQVQNTLLTIPNKLPDIVNKRGFRMIDIPSNDTIEIWGLITPARSNQVFFTPRIILPNFLKRFEVLNKPARSGQESGDYIFAGMMLMLAAVSVFRNIQRIRKLALYYSGYAFTLFIIFMLWATQQRQTTTFSFYTHEWIIFYMQLISFILYSLFMIKFLKTKTNHPFLHSIFLGSITISIIAFLLHATSNTFSLPYQFVFYIEKSTIYSQQLLLVLLLFYTSKLRSQIIFKYIFWGNLLLVVFTIISVVMSQAGSSFFSNSSFWANSLLYYQIGVILEMFFFQMALFNINQNLIKADIKEKQELQNNLTLQQYEKELAVYNAAKNERQHIAEGLHEKLGKGLSEIRFTSEIGAENNDELKRISKMTDDVLRSMNDLIWTLNTSNDDVKNLVDYFKKYAQNYFRLTHFNCIISTPPTIESQQIEQEERILIFTAYKECLKQILKESKSKEILIDIFCQPKPKIQIRTKEENPIERTIK